MSMLLQPQENARPLTTSDGILHAFTGSTRDMFSGTEHQWLTGNPMPISSSTWSITKDPVWAPGDFMVMLIFSAFSGAPFNGAAITYTEGANIPVEFQRVAIPTPPPASFRISWSELDGRQLPDGDEIVLSTHTRGRPGSFVELATSAQVDWWKAVHFVDPARRRDVEMVRTDGPNQSRQGLLQAMPASGGPLPPDPMLFHDLLIVLHKPKFLGSDTSIYQLDMNSAPFLSGPTTFHFFWRRQ